jgi:hypothetical protein
MRLLVITFTLIFFSASQQAEAAPEDHSGPALLTECEKNRDYCDALALGFVFGSIAAHDLPHRLCMPPETTAQELGQMLLTHMQKHPERLEVGQIGLVAEAIIKPFQCIDAK